MLLIDSGSFGPAIHRVVWSRRQPLASVGAVLSLLDGPVGCDPAFCVAWFRFRFRLLRRLYWLFGLLKLVRVYRLLEMVGEGGPGHGPIHLLSASAAEVGFQVGSFCTSLVSSWLTIA